MIVLDTHAWLWWRAFPDLLSRTAAGSLGAAEAIAVPAICCWEVAAAAARGRVELDRPTDDWLRDALAVPRLELAPLTPEVSVVAAGLPRRLHGDPADRLIVATALVLDAPLVTKDDVIRRARIVPTIW